MASDAEDGPRPPFVRMFTSRPAMNQDEFDRRFAFRKPANQETEFEHHLKRQIRRVTAPFDSPLAFGKAFLSFFPIIGWLPKYSIRENFVADILGGLTVGIMHVPQGIAYAHLAGVEPVIGLYTSFLPPLLYMFLGTSRHNSIGSFAVVSLMTGIAVRKYAVSNGLDGIGDGNLTTTTATIDGTTLATASANHPTAIEVASAITFCVGAIQLLTGILHLDFITAYFSDQLVSGFTTAASLHVFVSQLKDFFGLTDLPKRSGPGYLLLSIYDVCSRIPETHIPTLIVSLTTIFSLLIGKELINPLLRQLLRIPVPIPFELIIVVVATALSAIFHFHSRHDISIVDRIPTGFPTPVLPRFELFGEILPTAIGIAIVVFAVHISLAKMFAKKQGYEIDAGQELYALGFTSLASGLLPIYPVACSLGRTLVNVEAGTRTQLSSLFSSALLLGVIIYLGHYLRTLPMCVLSCIVLAALKGMFGKFSDLKTLWPLSKIDFSIWLVAFLSTFCIDVMEGLGISIVYALFTTIIREQWPRWHLLANLSGTNDYRDSERYEDVVYYRGICIFRFDSPLLFTNVERLRRCVHKALGEWQASWEPEERVDVLEELKIEQLGEEEEEEERRKARGSKRESYAISSVSKHFVIDCSGFTFVDCMGVSILKEVYMEMRRMGVLVYFAAAKAPVRDLFERCGFYAYVPKENFYPTIRDAVAIAIQRQQHNHVDPFISELEHDRLSEVMSSVPMH